MNKGIIILLSGWVIFICCLPLIAAHTYLGQPISGYIAGTTAISKIDNFYTNWSNFHLSLAGIVNILAVASPLVIFSRNILIKKSVGFGSAFGFIVALSFFKPSLQPGAGYYVWVLSFLVITLGVYYLVNQQTHNKSLNRTLGADAPPAR